MKRKLDIGTFNDIVLPTLQAKYADNDTLQKHIDDNYEVSDDKGAVTIKVATKSAPAADAGKIDELSKTIKTMATEIADLKTKGIHGTDIKVVTPEWMSSGLKLSKKIKGISGDTEAERRKGAWAWGAFFLGDILAQREEYSHLKHYSEKLKNAIQVKAQSEGINTAGGVLVPQELSNYIIDLREQYGVFRRNSRIAPMSRDNMTIPRRVSGLTVYWPGEGNSITDSSKAWDSVNLTAKKLAVIAKMSSEIIEDAIIDIGADLAAEIAYAFGLEEDTCGFTGDSTAAHGSIDGVNPRLKRTVGATTTSAGGVIVATDNIMSGVTLADLHAVVGALPNYADTPNTKWYCHRYFWSNVMERLARAAGGVTAAEIRGAAAKSFLGYPVEVSQVFPKTDANSQILCLFGDLSLATTFGDRREVTLSLSDQVYWANDQIGIRGTQRIDIKAHDVGTATVAGPIIGLQSLNS